MTMLQAGEAELLFKLVVDDVVDEQLPPALLLLPMLPLPLLLLMLLMLLMLLLLLLLLCGSAAFSRTMVLTSVDFALSHLGLFQHCCRNSVASFSDIINNSFCFLCLSGIEHEMRQIVCLKLIVARRTVSLPHGYQSKNVIISLLR